MLDKELIKQQFSKHFSTYDGEAEVQQSMARTLVAETLKHGKGFERVLEFGCGTGFLSRLLIQSVSLDQLWLNDLSEIPDVGLDHFIHLPGDAEKLEFPSELNLIVGNAVVQWFTDLESFIQKCHSSLSDNGVLTFSSFGVDNFKEMLATTGIGLKYLPFEDILKVVRRNGFEIEFALNEQRTLYFDDPKSVLRHCQRSGVNGIETKAWTKSDLRQFCENYETLTENNLFPLTYDPILIIAKKVN